MEGNKPFIEFIEKPSNNARFRFIYEGCRAVSPIVGVSSIPENRTYPSIKVVGYKGPAWVFVTCVTDDLPYRSHPYHLAGVGCKNGVCHLKIPEETMVLEFKGIGIQAVKNKDMRAALEQKEQFLLNTWVSGFQFDHEQISFERNTLRLCFQVFIGNDPNQECALEPLVSEIIYNGRHRMTPRIMQISEYECSVDDDKKNLILLCSRVAKDDIQIRFYEERDEVTVWEDFGIFASSNVHKQVAISFKPPKYHNSEISEPVAVSIQLRTISDRMASEPIEFRYLPSHKMEKKEI